VQHDDAEGLSTRRRVAVVGAGPIGLAAAFRLSEIGHEVTVFEGADVGHALTRWGETRFFSPLGMNVPAGYRNLLGGRLPPDDALLTGPEMVEQVLKPVARSPLLSDRIRVRHRVLAVGRAGMTRGEYAGHPLRAERPFQLLVRTPDGERRFEADVVLDASGVTGRPASLGSGGIPAPGEGALADRLVRDLGTLEEGLDSLAGRRILLVGHGHSAANAVLRLALLAGRDESTRVTWAVRTANRRPVLDASPDPLPERHRVASSANDLAAEPPPFLTVLRKAAVESLEAAGRAICVRFSSGVSGEFDSVVALTGFRPDLSFVDELALEISPATEGVARLSRALTTVTDCLSVPAVSAEDLGSGEPGFYLLGAKSYGRSRNFLLRTGLAHLEAILPAIGS
jgi:FAD dependent oxidoreductase